VTKEEIQILFEYTILKSGILTFCREVDVDLVYDWVINRFEKIPTWLKDLSFEDFRTKMLTDFIHQREVPLMTMAHSGPRKAWKLYMVPTDEGRERVSKKYTLQQAYTHCRYAPTIKELKETKGYSPIDPATLLHRKDLQDLVHLAQKAWKHPSMVVRNYYLSVYLQGVSTLFQTAYTPPEVDLELVEVSLQMEGSNLPSHLFDGYSKEALGKFLRFQKFIPSYYIGLLISTPEPKDFFFLDDTLDSLERLGFKLLETPSIHPFHSELQCGIYKATGVVLELPDIKHALSQVRKYLYLMNHSGIHEVKIFYRLLVFFQLAKGLTGEDLIRKFLNSGLIKDEVSDEAFVLQCTSLCLGENISIVRKNNVPFVCVWACKNSYSDSVEYYSLPITWPEELSFDILKYCKLPLGQLVHIHFIPYSERKSFYATHAVTNDRSWVSLVMRDIMRDILRVLFPALDIGGHQDFTATQAISFLYKQVFNEKEIFLWNNFSYVPKSVYEMLINKVPTKELKKIVGPLDCRKLTSSSAPQKCWKLTMCWDTGEVTLKYSFRYSDNKWLQGLSRDEHQELSSLNNHFTEVSNPLSAQILSFVLNRSDGKFRFGTPRIYFLRHLSKVMNALLQKVLTPLDINSVYQGDICQVLQSLDEMGISSKLIPFLMTHSDNEALKYLSWYEDHKLLPKSYLGSLPYGIPFNDFQTSFTKIEKAVCLTTSTPKKCMTHEGTQEGTQWDIIELLKTFLELTETLHTTLEDFISKYKYYLKVIKLREENIFCSFWGLKMNYSGIFVEDQRQEPDSEGVYPLLCISTAVFSNFHDFLHFMASTFRNNNFKFNRCLAPVYFWEHLIDGLVQFPQHPKDNWQMEPGVGWCAVASPDYFTRVYHKEASFIMDNRNLSDPTLFFFEHPLGRVLEAETYTKRKMMNSVPFDFETLPIKKSLYGVGLSPRYIYQLLTTAGFTRGEWVKGNFIEFKSKRICITQEQITTMLVEYFIPLDTNLVTSEEYADVVYVLVQPDSLILVSFEGSGIEISKGNVEPVQLKKEGFQGGRWYTFNYKLGAPKK